MWGRKHIGFPLQMKTGPVTENSDDIRKARFTGFLLFGMRNGGNQSICRLLFVRFGTAAQEP